MGTIEASVEKNIAAIEGQLRTWAAKLDELVEKSEKSSEQLRMESREQIASLRERLAEAQKTLQELKREESSRWDTFKADLHVALLDVEAAFKALARPPHETKQG